MNVERLLELSTHEVGQIIRNQKLGGMVQKFCNQIPYLEIHATVQPVTRQVLRTEVTLTPAFRWHDKYHGSVEAFWVWVEDPEKSIICHHEYFLLHKNKATEDHKLTFTIPISDPPPPQYYVRVLSDRWLGAENVFPLSFEHLILPEIHPPHTDLLDLNPLPVKALRNAAAESMYNFDYFNPIQTQCFHTVYHSDENIFLGAPTGSGKTLIAEMAIFRVLLCYPGLKVVYVAPMKALARERVREWGKEKSLKGALGVKICELTGDSSPDAATLKQANLLITTPEKWDGVSRSWKSREYVKQVGLVIIDEIHLLGQDRGPVLEVIVSRMRYISTHTEQAVRIVGLSTAISNAKDVSDWLGIERAGLFNFHPVYRPVPLKVYISGFPGKHYCPRMATMNKPTYAAITTHSPSKPVLVFVSSRRQTRLTGLDLISYCAADQNPRQWLHMSEDELAEAIERVRDPNLKHMLSFGIGIHHAGLPANDRSIVEHLYVSRKIQVLVCTSTLAWGVNFPAHLVVIKGTEYYDAKVRRYVDFPITDVLQMMGRAGRPQFDDTGKACVLVHQPKKNFYLNFLHSPFPVESSLLDHLHDHVNAEVVGETIASIQDGVDYLSWTFFFRRLLVNPSYYNLTDCSAEGMNTFLSNLVETTLTDLEEAGCVEFLEDDSVVPTFLGRISSYYYLTYTTVSMFSKKLSRESTLPELLDILSSASEFEELPVRHNEDKLNAELAEHVKLPVDPYSMDSPFTKANLLFQCHFSRIPMPVSDYKTDLRSVLDQAIRVMQALIDVSAEFGFLGTSLRVMVLMQMLIQARWVDESSLLNLPGCDQNVIGRLWDAGIECLPEIMAASPKKIAQLTKLPQRKREDLRRVIDMMPLVDTKISVPQTTVEAGGAGVVCVTLTRNSSYRERNKTGANRNRKSKGRHQGGGRGRGFPVHAPNWAKKKDEGWWLVVGMEEADELFALKRITLRGTNTYSLSFEAPLQPGEYTYQCYLMSDSYIGLDQEYSFDITVVEAEEVDEEYDDQEGNYYEGDGEQGEHYPEEGEEGGGYGEYQDYDDQVPVEAMEPGQAWGDVDDDTDALDNQEYPSL